MNKSGFTLLEILLAIAILAILAAVTLSAINPIRQLSEARDSQRKNDVSELHKAVQQYFIDKGAYPADVADDTKIYTICSYPVYSPVDVNCGGLTNIARVIPVYLSGIPTDPTSSKLGVDTLYRVAFSRTTGVYVEAPKTEIGQGDQKTIIYVGKPPRGYNIPVIKLDIGTTTVATFISNIPQNIYEWPEWIHQVIVFVVGIAIGFILRRGVRLPKAQKKP